MDVMHSLQVERIFRQSAEFCSEHEVWKLNVAHVFFMQVRGAYFGSEVATVAGTCLA